MLSLSPDISFSYIVPQSSRKCKSFYNRSRRSALKKTKLATSDRRQGDQDTSNGPGMPSSAIRRKYAKGSAPGLRMCAKRSVWATPTHAVPHRPFRPRPPGHPCRKRNDRYVNEDPVSSLSPSKPLFLAPLPIHGLPAGDLLQKFTDRPSVGLIIHHIADAVAGPRNGEQPFF